MTSHSDDRLIDLHAHSIASDGTFSPVELVEHAASLGLSALALTDHDTVNGLSDAAAAAQRLGIEFIPGVELSVNCDHINPKGQLHLVGLFIDPENEVLQEGVGFLRQKREERVPRIIKKLAEMGVEIPEEVIFRIAGGGAVGRPHVARALVEMGIVDTMQEVFDVYLKKGAPCYVPKDKFDLGKAISMVAAAGGIPILAHPKFLKIDDEALSNLLDDMMDLGLKGMEVYYSVHSPEERERYLRIAQEKGLLVSGGSDFHGSNKPKIELGSGMGDLTIPYALLEKMKDTL